MIAKHQESLLTEHMIEFLAYLDLGAGSMLLQMILAGLLGFTFVVKTYWRRFLNLFRSRPVEDESPVPEPTPSDESRS